MMSQIRKHLLRSSANKLSLAGRIMVSNQVVLSSIWYLASCTDFSGKSLKLARATVRNYMWSGKLHSRARARVKWSTAVLPIVRGGVKILDPEWQTSALLVKLLIRGMSVGYEPWKALVRYRVAQTKQSRRGRWPAHANWIMNAAHLVQQGSPLWQGVMRAWSTIQSGIEQQDPQSWSEIARQPLYGNRFLTSDKGIQWGTELRTNMRWWSEKQVRTLQDIARPDWEGWRTFPELRRLKRTSVAPNLYAKVVNSIPWTAQPMPPHQPGQWIAAKEEDGSIKHVYHIQHTNPMIAQVYNRLASEQLQLIGQSQPVPIRAMREVRVLRCGGEKKIVLDYNPRDETDAEHSLWLWGNDWVSNLAWDPKDWQWRRLGMLPDTSVMNYTTKRGYRVALKQNTQPMNLDVELEREGFNSKARARFFNRIWHPYLPRKVAAMQWLILTEGLPVGAWRAKIGLPDNCELCSTPIRETLQHALQDCPHLSRAWDLYRNTRKAAKLPPSYNTWQDISRGLMREPLGPQIDEELRWDATSVMSLNADTPWDLLRAQLLWSIWCQKVHHTFRSEKFHLGVVLWHAWRNTIYCAMEAYKELFRHKRNEEKRQEVITCFQQIWTSENIFGRLQGSTIKWNVTPHPEFLPKELGAWTIPPIRINRLSPSPDIEAEFAARPDFANLVDAFVSNIGNNWQPPTESTGSDRYQEDPQTNTPQGTTSQSLGEEEVTQMMTSQESSDSESQPSHRYFPDGSKPRHTPPSHSTAAENGTQYGDTPSLPPRRNCERRPLTSNGADTDGRCASAMNTISSQTGDPQSSFSHSLVETKKDNQHKGSMRTSTPTPWDSLPGAPQSPQIRKHDFERQPNNEEVLPDMPRGCPQPSSCHANAPPYGPEVSRQVDFTAPASDPYTNRGPQEKSLRGVTAETQLRSRPKRRCSRRLRHPSQRSQGNKTNSAKHDSKQVELRDLKQNRGNKEDNIPAQLEQIKNDKPTSRPKRKCRFGPRARCLHREQRCNANYSLPAQVQPRGPTGTQHGKDTPPSPQSRRATPSTDTWLQDRVPLHKDKSRTRQPEVNTSRLPALRLGITEAEEEAELTKEIDELLKEIDVTRQGVTIPDQEGAISPQARGTVEKELSGDRPHLRQDEDHKDLPGADPDSPYPTEKEPDAWGKSKIDKTTRKGRARERTTSVSRDPPPSPPQSRTRVLEERNAAPLCVGTRYGRKVADGIRLNDEKDWSQEGYDQVPEDITQVILPDRPTICHFSYASPYAHYRGLPPAAPKPPPFRPIHARLGISESEFEARITSEIDEVLFEVEEERRRARAPTPSTLVEEAPSSSLKPLSKEDCLAYFRTHGYPTPDSPGSLWGMYWWAADLGSSRFNFEFDFDKDDINILNAYD